MPNEFEVASPFDEIDEATVEMDDALHAESVEINARRAEAESAERLRLARAI